MAGDRHSASSSDWQYSPITATGALDVIFCASGWTCWPSSPSLGRRTEVMVLGHGTLVSGSEGPQVVSGSTHG
jgi:hypothetical protein